MARPSVYFRLKTKFRIQRDKYSTNTKPLLGIIYISPHRSFTSLKPVLIAQAIVDPSRDVALLFRFVFVSIQPSINNIQVGAQDRIG